MIYVCKIIAMAPDTMKTPIFHNLEIQSFRITSSILFSVVGLNLWTKQFCSVLLREKEEKGYLELKQTKVN